MKQKLLNNFRLRALMLVALLCSAFTGAWADSNISTVTTTFSAEGNVTNKFTQTGDFTKATWNLAVTWKSSTSWQSLNATKGAQVGSGSKPATSIVLTGSSISGTISSVVVNTSGASSVNATVAVSVGGTTFTCDGSSTASLTSSAADYTFEGSGTGDIVITWTNSSSKAIYIKSITTTYTAGDPGKVTPTVAVSGDLTLDLNGGTSVSAGTLAAAVTYNEAAVEGATVTWSSNAEDVATINASTGAVTLLTTGEVTFTATYAGDDTYNEAIGTKTVTVVDSKAPGSEDNPYTVAQAIAAIDASTGTSGVYVKGIVSTAATSLNSNGSLTYFISDDGTTTTEFEIYKGFGIDGAEFTDATDIKVGDKVVVYGDITYYSYGDIYEFSSGSTLISQSTRTLSSIALSGDYTTTFHQGDAFSHDGMVVTATYDDATTADVTESAEFSGYDMSTIGEQTVTVSYTENEVTKTTSYTITISAPATLTSIALSGEYPTEFSVGDEFSTEGMVVTATYDDATEKVVTESTTFSGYDMSTAGEQTVTVSYTENEVKQTTSYDITVNTVAVTGITLDKTSTNVNTGNNVTLTATIAPANATNQNITWTSSDDDVATVSNGTVTGVAEGTATITATTEDGSFQATCEVTVVFVEDYVDLPFEYYGNGSSAVTGLTFYGLGTYSSSPKMKFDDTGDYLILKTNEAPGVLTYDIKGNSFSGGTFTLQESADGTNYSDVKTYSELDATQSETVSTLASTTRYIKWIYTNKSSGNVALGNITLAAVSTDPNIAIDQTSVNVEEAGAEGTIEVTYNNFDGDIVADIAFYEADGETEATYDWIAAEINDQTKNVDFIVGENTGAARTAYFKVYALDAQSNEVYSTLITITQAKSSAASLPFSFDGGSSDIASTTGLTASGLGSDYKSAPYLKFDGTGDNLVLRLSQAPGIIAFDIVGNSFSGGTFTVQTSADGESYTDLAAYTDLSSSTTTMMLANTDENVRYIKWIYTSKSSGNVGLGNIKVSANGYARTITAGSFGTICLPYDVAADDYVGVTFYQIDSKKTIDGDLQYITLAEVTEGLTAGVAYLFQAEEEATQLVAAYSGEEADEPITAEESGTGLTGTYEAAYIPVSNYILKENKIYYVDKENYVKTGDNKAYIDLTDVKEEEEASVKGIRIYSENNIATGINSIAAEAAQGKVYNLAGQRVSKATKGLYIVNGKKTLVK